MKYNDVILSSVHKTIKQIEYAENKLEKQRIKKEHNIIKEQLRIDLHNKKLKLTKVQNEYNNLKNQFFLNIKYEGRLLILLEDDWNDKCIKYKEYWNIQRKQWYIKNYNKISENNRIRRTNRTEEEKQQKSQYQYNYIKQRKQTDLLFRIEMNIRSNIGASIKNNSKCNHSIELLGCSVEFFKQHIERQFRTGMTWNNYGKFGWHYDHIIGVCNFNLSKEDEQYKCFNYTNYQPLWCKDNWSKKRYI